jgi:hypothetical protein
MNARPTSVTVIGWILIVFGICGLLGMLLFAGLMNSPLVQQTMEASRVPASVQLAVGFAGVAVYLVCGISLLKRQGWARFVYAIWGLASFVYMFLSSPYPSLLMIPSAVLYLVIVFFLFRPAARTYFAGKDSAPAI